MSQLLSIYRAIQFIEQNLGADIAVADMAEAAAFSLYHFCRVFTQVAHHSPYDYLMRRRLSEAARDLLETDKKITDIGFDYQFNSPETFSRAFKRMFAMQPSQWKKQACLKPFCLLPAFSLEYLEHINRGDYLKPVFAPKPSLWLAGVVSLVENNAPEAVKRLWDILAQELAGYKTATWENCYGVTWYPADGRWPGFFYMAAIELKTPETAPPGLVSKVLPAATYARFIHRGSWAARHLTLDYIYQTWLPNSGQYLGSPLELEFYGPRFFELDTAEAETKIYIPLASA